MGTFTDLIHSRQRTTGVNKIKFALPDKNGAFEEIYEIFDVGGQKNERRKWMHFLIIQQQSYLLQHCLDIISCYGKIIEIIVCEKQLDYFAELLIWTFLAVRT